MIKHIVLLKLASDVKPEQIEKAMQKLCNLKREHISQIRSFNHGKNCSIENLSQGFNYGFAMEFASDEDRDYYVNHPAHIKIASEDIVPLTENGISSVVVLDYEFI